MSLMEAEYGVTDLAMQGSVGRYNGDETLMVKFFSNAKMNQTKSKAASRPIFEDVDYIQIMQPGNKDSIIVRPATARDKDRFAEHFKKYKARETEDHIEGTLLEAWPGVTRAQCEELRFFNVRTVEQLAGMSDSNSQNLMGIQMLKQKALKYLETAKDDATSEALEEQRNLNATLLARLEALEAGEVADEVPAELTSGQKAAATRARNKAAAAASQSAA